METRSLLEIDLLGLEDFFAEDEEEEKPPADLEEDEEEELLPPLGGNEEEEFLLYFEAGVETDDVAALRFLFLEEPSSLGITTTAPRMSSRVPT